MIKAVSLQQLHHRFGGELINGSVQFDTVCTDTRKLNPESIFVALIGETFDAHNFISELAGKVLGAVVKRQIPGSKLPQWIVPDTTVALGQIGLLCREQFVGQVIAVTGSCGKTTVKELLSSIFSRQFQLCVTQGNLNNQFGVPATLFSLAPQDDVLIIEMGANGLGEIDYLCGIAKPQISAVTNVLPAHIEGFGSLEGIARTKGQIYSSLKSGGTAVINADDAFADYWRSVVPKKVRCVDVGLSSNCVLYATNITLNKQGCAKFDLMVEGQAYPVQLQLLGVHNVHNALVAAGCAFAAGIPAAEIAIGLAFLAGVKARLQTVKGLNDATIIDDSYNANPGSVAAAIELLAQGCGEKILVLGDMAELGADEAQLHREVGQLARARGIDQLLTFGPLSAAAAESFNPGRSQQNSFDDQEALIAALENVLNSDTTVLVKGSRSARMECIVQALTK
ncbi:MAG: UDP-N-acetylmuramoyl-tripeptide--D-alanyl-D-alanine ligase [Gammaproteobacteria bacterium]|nr:UDP-N-acetylmuramoyl-tripeptide--D-alanyl-D-alanine ligase [Gammaproteobacteria bacterium]